MRRLALVVLFLLLLVGTVSAGDYESSDPSGAWISPGEILIRSFTSSSDIDRVRFSATEGRSYELVFTAIDDIDGEMFVSRQSGTLLAYSDDDTRFETFDPRVRFIAGDSETVSVMLREYNGTEGDYSITLIERGVISSDFSLNTSTIGVGENLSASITVSCTGGPCGNVTVTLDPYIDPVAKRNPEGALTIRTAEGYESIPAISRAKLPAHVVARLEERAPARALEVLHERGLIEEEVEAIYGALEVRPMLDESVAYIGADSVWSESTGSGSVCVIDTGVDYTHPALGGCTSAQFLGGSCPVVIGGYDFVNNDNDPMDTDGHGTHVAGIIASRDSVYRGVAPNATIVAVRVLSSTGDPINVARGVEYCLENQERFNISSIVMSLGIAKHTYHGTCDRRPYSENISAVAQQIPTFVAAGNEFETTAYLGTLWPACVPNVIPVGSVTLDDIPSPSSNRDLKTIFAPGEWITSLDNGGGTASLRGTSMAAPHAAGATALFSSLWNDRYGQALAPMSIRYLLELGDTITDPFSDTSYTRINVSKSAQFKGVVPTTPGARPFWTSNDNPVLCELDDGESCSIDWNVIAEGPIGSYVFFAYLEDEFAITKSPSDSVVVLSEFESLTYDPVPVDGVLAIGPYTGTVTLREDASAGWIAIDAPGSANDVSLPLTLEDARTFSFERTIVQDVTEGAEEYSFIFTIDDSNVTLEHNASYGIDTSYPIASGPALLAANGSFNVTFSERMNVGETSVSFPPHAQATSSASWLSGSVVEIAYGSNNVSFDDTVDLSWGFTDAAGNPAEAIELRLDARSPNVSLVANASNVSRGEQASFTVTPSEPLANFSYASDHLDCTNETSLLASQIVLTCTPNDGIELDAAIVFNVTDVAGNRASIGSSTIRIDTLAPRASDVSLVTRTGANVQVPILFEESATPVTFSTGDVLDESGIIVLLADAASQLITVTDAFGNEATLSVSFTFDDTPPLTVSDAIDAWQQGPVQVGFAIDDTNDATTYTVYRNDAATGDLLFDDEGVHAFLFRSIDAAGNREGWKRGIVRVDNSEPVVSLSTSRDATSRYIHVTASDARSGIDEVIIDQNGVRDVSRSGATWTARISNASVNVRVIDHAGNIFEDTLVVGDIPMVSSSPAVGSYIKDSIELSFVGDALNYTFSNGTSGSATSSVTFTPEEGVFTISGNITNDETIDAFSFSYAVDRTPPVLVIEASSEADGIVQVNLSAIDAALDRVEILRNGVVVASGMDASYDLDPLSDGVGSVELLMRAYDLAGNIAEEELTINFSLPEPTVYDVDNGSITPARTGIGSYLRSISGLDSETVMISLSSDANVSGIDEVVANFTIDGSSSGAIVEIAIPSLPDDIALWHVSDSSTERLSYDVVHSESRLRIIRFETDGFSDFVFGTEYAVCSEGAVSSACLCGAQPISSGYCCSGISQSSTCTPEVIASGSGSGGSSGGSSGSFISRSTTDDNVTNESQNVTIPVENATLVNESVVDVVNISVPLNTTGSDDAQNTTSVTGMVVRSESSVSPIALFAGIVLFVSLVVVLLFVFKRRVVT